VNIGLVEWTCL
jgi:hypothetical protein